MPHSLSSASRSLLCSDAGSSYAYGAKPAPPPTAPPPPLSGSRKNTLQGATRRVAHATGMKGAVASVAACSLLGPSRCRCWSSCRVASSGEGHPWVGQDESRLEARQAESTCDREGRRQDGQKNHNMQG